MDMGRTTAAAWLSSGRTPTPNTMGGYYRHLESVFQPGDGPRGGRVSVLEGDEKRVVALPFVVKPYGRCCNLTSKRSLGDLTDLPRPIARPSLPKPAKVGRRPIDRRESLNPILIVNRTGCHGTALPHDFPNWKTVSTVFWRWRRECLWKKIHDGMALSSRSP